MRSGDARRTGLSRLAGAALAIVAFCVLFGAAPPSAHLPGSIRQLVEEPTEGNGAAGALDPLVLVLIVVLAVIALGLLIAALVFFRTRGSTAGAPPSEGWWTCPKCGAGNMDGAPRCHNCATWRSTTPKPTTSPTR